MRILHTADWHFGQSLNGFSREYEHEDFAKQLCQLLDDEKIDIMLVAGDIYDTPNPSGESQRLFYETIAKIRKNFSHLQIIIIAGNHDSAQRLEAPEDIFNVLNIQLIGTLKRDDKRINLNRHLIPLKNAENEIGAYVLAIPFLRQADLPNLQLAQQENGESSVIKAVRELYKNMCEDAEKIANGLPILAMAHLTCAGGLESEGAERRILIGGDHAVPPDIFPKSLSYVALGHLHKPQSLDGGRVRYAGSPFPLSASEINYNHGVTIIDSADFIPRHVPLKRPVPLYRLPSTASAPFAEVAKAFKALDLLKNIPHNQRAFLYLAIDADRPINEITAMVDALLENQPIRLAHLSILKQDNENKLNTPPPSLSETTPEQLFQRAFKDYHGSEAENSHLAAFRDALSDIEQ